MTSKVSFSQGGGALDTCPYCRRSPVDWKIESPNLYGRNLRCDLRCHDCDGRMELDASAKHVRLFNLNGRGNQTALFASCRPSIFDEIKSCPKWLKVVLTVQLALASVTIAYGNLGYSLTNNEIFGALTIGIWLSHVALLIFAAVFAPQFKPLAGGTLLLLLLLIYSMSEIDFRYSALTCLIVAVGLGAIGFGLRFWNFGYHRQSGTDKPVPLSIRTIMILIFVVAALLTIARHVTPARTMNSGYISLSIGAIPTALLAFWTSNISKGIYRLAITVVFAFVLGLFVSLLISSFDLQITGVVSFMYVTEALGIAATMQAPQLLGYRITRAF